MLSCANNDPKPRLLRVYELKSDKGLPDPPADGLAGVWPQPPWYYLFYEREALEAVLAWLERYPEWHLFSRYTIPYEKWQDVSTQDLSVGPFTVMPAGAERELPAEDSRDLSMAGERKLPVEPHSTIPIRIDPGVVFGSGLHPTTRGCLLAISELFAACSKIDTVLDLGTGTGILAIACVLLGAGRARAIDCVPFALAVARRNAAANGVEDRIGFICADSMEVLNAPSDLLVMNIEWPVQEKVLASGHWRRYRHVILSGFLEGTAAAVERAVATSHAITGKVILEGWPTLTLRKTEDGGQKADDG